MFPNVLEAGLRVSYTPLSCTDLLLQIRMNWQVLHLSKRSVKYEIGIFKRSTPDAVNPQLCALGHFVHVFVERGTMKPVGIPERILRALEKLLVVQSK